MPRALSRAGWRAKLKLCFAFLVFVNVQLAFSHTQEGGRRVDSTSQGWLPLGEHRSRAQVRIKLKHMEIEIRRRETTGAGAAVRNESETLAKYEIMDGAPVRGENIPIRSPPYQQVSCETLSPKP